MNVDICVIGGGLCGIGVASYLKNVCRNKSFALIEKRDDLGGTWDLFRYPGIRTDSDMYTYGYHFKAFSGDKIFREGSEIKEYIKNTAQENGLGEIILLGHAVQRVEWQSGCARWTIHSLNTSTAAPFCVRSQYVLFCTGYYAYDSGYTPEFTNMDRFEGTIVHPQAWPEDLDYAGKDVVIIGSGATSVTLAPVLAERAQHVTVLQRSPTYVVPMPLASPTAAYMYEFLPAQFAYTIVRCLFILYQIVTTVLLSSYPSLGRKIVLSKTARALGDETDSHIGHFTPSYNPWEQRLCLCPNGDLFDAIKSKKVSYVTDEVKSFSKDGLMLKNQSSPIRADIVVMATGFNLQALGGIEVMVNGVQIDPADCFTYKGVMLCGVPNFFWCMGYNGASLTLKVEPVAVYISRVMQFMETNKYASIQPNVPPLADQNTSSKRVFSSSSTYVKRNGHLFPKQACRAPWVYIQDYLSDIWPLKYEPLRRDDKHLQFS